MRMVFRWQSLVVVAILCVVVVDEAVGCPMAAVFGGRRSLMQAVSPSPAPALQFGFYATTCPNVSQIVADRVNAAVLQDIQTPGKLLRLFFHDCVAAGCDASILLNSTATVQAEKDATISVTLDKFEVIDDIKAHVEAACPGIVSCADILALAAVNAVRLAGGPSFDIDLGRRDGVVSYLAAATASVPLSTMKVDALLASMALAGLDQTDLVVLSGGAHDRGGALHELRGPVRGGGEQLVSGRGFWAGAVQLLHAGRRGDGLRDAESEDVHGPADAEQLRHVVLREPDHRARRDDVGPGPVRRPAHAAPGDEFCVEPHRLLRELHRVHAQDGAPGRAHRHRRRHPQPMLADAGIT